MLIENLPFCCTSAVLGSLGEHGEDSLVTVDEVKRLIKSKVRTLRDSETGETIAMGKRCILATSVNPANVAILKRAGFQVVDFYPGIQGIVHIMTFHVEPDAE